jgi:pilin isopeptide linkage protein
MEVTVTVSVSDAGDGVLDVSVEYPEDTTFNNKYEAENSLVLEASKVLTGSELGADEFSFVLKDEAGEVLQTKKNAVDGSIAFDQITYTEQDVGKVFVYTIEEVDGGLGWIIYDKHVLKVTVEVTDLGHGELDLDVSYEVGQVFTNRYDPVGSYAPVATKVADGFTLEADAFEFELVDASGKVLQTARNTAIGGVQFAPLTFGVDDIGKTYVYTIREVEGELEGIIYDDEVYTLTLTVTDLGDGKLAVERKVGEDPAIFTNVQEQVLGDEDEIIEGDDDQKAPATGQQLSVYTYLAILLILISIVAFVLAVKPRKKDTTA